MDRQQDTAGTTPGTGSGVSHLPQVEVRPHNGRPTVFIEGVPHALTGFNTFGREPFERSMALAYQDGYDVYFIHPQAVGDWPGTRFWVGDRIEAAAAAAEPRSPFDLDEQAEHILTGDPDGWIMVRYGVWPPASWARLHPEELFIAADGSPGRVPSLASEVFCQAAARYAGAHVYCETDDVLLADSAIVALHSPKSEPKRLSLPGEFRVHDVIGGEVRSGPRARDHLSPARPGDPGVPPGAVAGSGIAPIHPSPQDQDYVRPAAAHRAA